MPSRRPVPPELSGAAEIAKILGVSRQRVSQITADEARKTNGFPEPWTRLAMGSIWLAEEVREWAAKHRPARGEPPRRTS